MELGYVNSRMLEELFLKIANGDNTVTYSGIKRQRTIRESSRQRIPDSVFLFLSSLYLVASVCELPQERLKRDDVRPRHVGTEQQYLSRLGRPA